MYYLEQSPYRRFSRSIALLNCVEICNYLSPVKHVDKIKLLRYTLPRRKELVGMSTDREALLKEALQMQRIVIASIIQEVTLPRWLELHISMAQLKGVFVLRHFKQSTISEFAEMLHIGRSAASLLVDRMVQDGLVERTEDTEDRRRMMIRLSPHGVEMADRLRQEKNERDQLPVWIEKLSTSDLQALAQGLRALAAVAQAATGAIGPWQPYQEQEQPKA
jgi:DNA-binding MarR family transcriptional regulator